MNTQRMYANVYRCGFYHRQGKPGVTNLHLGDLYTTEDAAKADAEPESGYLYTVPLDVPVQEGATILANPLCSVPTPLHVTRNGGKLLPFVSPARERAAWQAFSEAQELEQTPLESGDDPLDGMSYEQWRDQRRDGGYRAHTEALPVAPAGLYKPAHGGYPDA